MPLSKVFSIDCTLNELQDQAQKGKCRYRKYSLSTALAIFNALSNFLCKVPLSKVFSIDCTVSTERIDTDTMFVPLSKVFSIDCTYMFVNRNTFYLLVPLSKVFSIDCTITPDIGLKLDSNCAVIESILYRLHFGNYSPKANGRFSAVIESILYRLHYL